MSTQQDNPQRGRANEMTAFMLRNQTTCSECGQELWPGNLLRKEGAKGLCMECADLDHLEYLPSGDTAITRRATKYSRLRVVVVQWSRTRKRYERQGILAEPEAIRRAEEESLADADLRERRRQLAGLRREEVDQAYVAEFARVLRTHYPSCPVGEEHRIAAQACQKYSGRVGRSAAAKEFDPEAIRRAVIAHIRHVHTDYDVLLCRYDDREMARAEVRERVQELLAQWQEPAK